MAKSSYSGSVSAKGLLPGKREGGLRPLLDLSKGLTGDAEGIHTGGNPAIDRDLEEDFADLVLADAVGQCAFDMHLQLVRAVERAQHGEVQHAAGFLRQGLEAPDGSPAVF